MLDNSKQVNVKIIHPAHPDYQAALTAAAGKPKPRTAEERMAYKHELARRVQPLSRKDSLLAAGELSIGQTGTIRLVRDDG